MLVFRNEKKEKVKSGKLILLNDEAHASMKKLGIGLFVYLLLIGLAANVSAIDWDGVPDNPNPAQTIWVDPEKTACLSIGETFVVDLLVNVTSPTSPGGTGMFGFEYKFNWDTSVIDANATSFTYHVPSGWAPPNGFLVKDDWTVPGRHWFSYTSLTGGPFTGVMSLGTYTFEVVGDGSSSLGIQDVKIVDNTATVFITDVSPGAGTVLNGVYCPEALQYQLTIDVIGNGTTDPAPGSYQYNEGTMVSVDAIPDSGWILDHWELDSVDVGAEDPYEVTMNINHTLTAVFVEFVVPPVVGDINGDGIVDIYDGVIIGTAYSTRPGDPLWNPEADLYNDEFIDIQDVVLWALDFGKKV